MSFTTYDFLNAITPQETYEQVDSADMGYLPILETVRHQISEKHADELAKALTDVAGGDILRNLIIRALAENNFDPSYVEAIFQDMAGFGLLTKYLQDNEVEEININSYAHIEVVYGDQVVYLEQGFVSPQAAIDIVKKMARMGGHQLDAVTPHVDSYIGDGTRISAMIPPIVPDDVGVVASIRKQNKGCLTRDDIINGGVATPQMVDFLSMCITHGISIGIAGGTSAGKTADESFLLNTYIDENNDWNNRIYLIEDTREIKLKQRDEVHNRPARVVSTVTKGGANPVTMRDLISEAMRFHPRIIVPVEVRGAEALEAATAGITGHTILTSLHAPDARTAYDRLLFMCQQAGTTLSEKAMLDLCVTAWPIMCCKKQLRDGSRKYMEIFEATGTKDGKVQGKMLFRFQVEHEDKNKYGAVTKVHGKFEQVGTPSRELVNRLTQEGATEEDMKKCFPNVNMKDYFPKLDRKGD